MCFDSPITYNKNYLFFADLRSHVFYGGSMLAGSQISLIVMQTTFVFFFNESGMQ